MSRKRQLYLEQDYVWMAAFIDGEGSACIRKRKGVESTSYEAEIRVYNTDPRCFPLFLKYYGGKVYEQTSQNTKAKQRFVWRCPTSKVCGLILDLYPYFILKRERVDLLLELLKMHPDILKRGRGLKDKGYALIEADEMLRRHNLWKTARVLNRRGPK